MFPSALMMEQFAPTKHRYLPTSLERITARNTVINIFSAVRTSNFAHFAPCYKTFTSPHYSTDCGRPATHQLLLLLRCVCALEDHTTHRNLETPLGPTRGHKKCPEREAELPSTASRQEMRGSFTSTPPPPTHVSMA
jgi:hypothetical protein